MRPTFRHFFIQTLLLACTAGQVLAQQPFDCDGSFYFVAASGSNSSSLARISKDSSLSAGAIVTTISTNIGHKVTAIGYNVQDNFIYGLERFTWNLLRIGSDGGVENLGVPQNLDLGLEYFAGEVRPQGGGLSVIGRTPGGNDKALYSINLLPPYHAGLASIITDEPTRIGDLAFDPVFGSLFGFDENQKRLVKVGVGGLVTSVHYEQQPQLGSVGALFFDRWGNLYGINGSGGQSLILFNKFNGKVVKTFNGPGGGFTDGCSCPYRIDLLKRIEPRLVVPCSEVTMTYTFLNTAATAYGQKTFYDEFPPAFTITEIVRRPHSTIVSGVGSHVLELSGMEVLLDRDSIVIRVDVGDFSGEYAGQAIAGGFPLGLGLDLPSDDPLTPEPDDPTAITVASDANLILEKTPKICPGSSATLTAASNGISYLWSNGSTGVSVSVSEPGLYWVEVLGECGLYRDTVLVEMAGQPWIDLGGDRTVPFGQTLTLTYSASASDNPVYSWEAAGAMLDCSHCPNPRATLLTPATFSVTLTDAHGCTATDSLQVSIRETRQVFFPNAFSPNGDGINDTFYPQAEGDFFIKHLRVFDRWGGMLFEKKDGRVNDAATGWDGTARGKVLDFGAYVWQAVIEFPDGRSGQFEGEVVLVR